MDKPVNVPVDNPNADTEWNDILRKHGVIPDKPPSPTPIIQEAIQEARRHVHDNRLENKDLDELDELEDEEDEAFLEKYRSQRLAELATISTLSVFNQVFPLQKLDYPREVTEASNKAFVLVHLTSSLETNVESRVLTELWREMALKFGDVKFCEMKANMCIEGYPEKNTPTILVYRDGDIKQQIVTLKTLNGQRTGLIELQNLLVEVGAVNASDYRVQRSKHSDDDGHERQVRKGKGKHFHTSAGEEADDDDDDDWE